MKEFDVDFHIHSKYSGGTSPKMLLPEIARGSQQKGLNLVGTSDATHPDWLKHIRDELTEEKDGVYSIAGFETKFLITTEIEDDHRVHHVVLFPSIESAEKFRAKLKGHSVDLDREGRPHVRLNGEQLAGLAGEVGALIGPSHAFTPWTAVYKEYDSLAECYGKFIDEIHFLELGLSAETDVADRIKELSKLTFLSNSDCHSPLPHRLGREFNRLLLKELSFSEVNKAIMCEGGRKFTLNVGLNPREGKYHLTACTRCFTKFKWPDALKLKRRCPECNGIIKKGVVERINELASYDKPKHPKHRPPYVKILPLAEVISLAIGVKTLTSVKVQTVWNSMIEEFGTEINVLVDEQVSKIKAFNPSVGGVIERFRTGRMYYVGGGGGMYGRPSLKKECDVFYGLGQKCLSDY